MDLIKKSLTALLLLKSLQALVTEEKFVVTSVNCAIDSGGSSIRISGSEYSMKKDGLNIVVYDPQKSQLITRNSFTDTVSRNFHRFISNIPYGSLVLVTSQLLCSAKSSIDLKIQKAIINGLKRFGFNTRKITPLDLRSAVYVFCKGICLVNMTSSIKFPFKAIHGFNEDPILLSFSLFRKLFSVASSRNNSHDASQSATLYIAFGCFAAALFVSMAFGAFCWYRRTKRRFQHRASCKRKAEKTERCECELTFSKQAMSARLFSEHKLSNRDASKTSFAAYIKVAGEDKETVYKIPSNVLKHDSPSYIPDNLLNTPSYCKESTSSLSASYILPHEYASPLPTQENDEEENFEEQNVTDTFFEETLRKFTEYTSLEPFKNEEYVVPQNESNGDGNLYMIL